MWPRHEAVFTLFTPFTLLSSLLSCAFCPARLLQTASVHLPGTRLGVLQVPCTGTHTNIVNTHAAQAAGPPQERQWQHCKQSHYLGTSVRCQKHIQGLFERRRESNQRDSRNEHMLERLGLAGTWLSISTDLIPPDPTPGQFCNRSKANCHCFWLRQAPHSY